MTADTPRVSVVVPAYNENEHIVPVLDRLFESVRLPCEVLVVVDTEDDSTIPVVAEYAQKEPRIRCLINTYGRGPANAIRFGIDAAAAPVAVVTMADGCDDPRQIDDLARLVDRGVAVAAASRYMPGGQQVGGPVLKGFLSKAAGRSLRLFAHIGTRLGGLQVCVLRVRRRDDQQVRLGQHPGQRRQIRVGRDVRVGAQHPVRLELENPFELVRKARPDVVGFTLEGHAEDADGHLR